MVARSGGYYCLPFKGYRIVTQVNPLSPILFNMVVDTVIRHWVAMMVATKEVTEVLSMLIKDLAE